MTVPPAVTIRHASKTFVSQRALDDVSFDILPGQVHALVGQNGCGKSTLIKLLAGYHAADEGTEILVKGQELSLGSQRASDEAGLRFVHQDLGLVPTLSSVENIALGSGYPLSGAKLINWRTARRNAEQAMRALGYDINVSRPVGELAMSERTAVAVARALAPSRGEPNLLVLDEPTANLPRSESIRLFDLVRTVARRGISVLFVSHHLDEVFAIADTVSVLRDGREVTTAPAAALDRDALVHLMVGREVEKVAERDEPDAAAAPRLVVRGLRTSGLKGVDLAVEPGEILGVAGLTGSGREQLALAVFGGTDRDGTVEIDGRELKSGRPARSVSIGAALVPAERRANAVFPLDTVRSNVSIVRPGASKRFGLISPSREKRLVGQWLAKLGVVPLDSEREMETLSGGNQQKVVLARWLRTSPTVLILDDPTQGVDIAAKVDIHTLVSDAAQAGAAILLVSTDHEELSILADRVAVLVGGRVAEILGKKDLASDRITAATLASQQRRAG